MPLTEERMEAILLEEVVDRRPQTLDRSDEEREHRATIRRQVKRMKKFGIEVQIPNYGPDITE